MADYTALTAEWATLSGTTAEKLAAINALTVAGPNQDVPPSAVVAYLALNGKFAALMKYAQSPPATDAGVAAANFAAIIGLGNNAPIFEMSVPATYAAIEAMLDALASDPASGVASADVAALLALAATAVPWWQANGYTSPIGPNDLAAAGGLA
jgi:hypothetical protein